MNLPGQTDSTVFTKERGKSKKEQQQPPPQETTNPKTKQKENQIKKKNTKQPKNPTLENIGNIVWDLPGSITAQASATAQCRTVTCSNCTQTQILTYRVKALSF